MSRSRHLSEKQLAAICVLGDCMIPGDGEMPSFSASGCVRQVDRILDYMPPTDLGDLKTLLGIFALLPRVLVAFILRLLEWSQGAPSWLGILRLIRLGLRGLIMSLYYDDPGVLKTLGYQVGVYTGDLPD